jgi:predicted alpha/beta hydrolase family esterase
MRAARILVLPGLGNSGPDHWQTLWEQQYGYARVTQHDWERPDRARWVDALDQAVARTPDEVVLVAHSLACAVVAHWSRHAPPNKVIAALLVAPADVDCEQHTPPETRGFAPMPLDPLPFPALVVASSNDPYVDFFRAEQFAHRWGASFVSAGAVGHINSASGLGSWREGHRLLEALLDPVHL